VDLDLVEHPGGQTLTRDARPADDRYIFVACRVQGCSTAA
jgi:hypothetical protein